MYIWFQVSLEVNYFYYIFMMICVVILTIGVIKRLIMLLVLLYPSAINLKIKFHQISSHELFVRSNTIGQLKMDVTD